MDYRILEKIDSVQRESSWGEKYFLKQLFKNSLQQQKINTFG